MEKHSGTENRNTEMAFNKTVSKQQMIKIKIAKKDKTKKNNK